MEEARRNQLDQDSCSSCGAVLVVVDLGDGIEVVCDCARVTAIA